MASKKELIVKKEDLNRVVEKKRVASGISYKVFEIPKGKSIGFRLKATTGTINIKETQERVYWIAQSTKEFKSATFLGWKSGAAEKELHEFLDMLDDEPGKWKDYGVKSNYIKSFEVVKGEFIYKPKSISYNGSEEGKGIWLEACNYYPSYGSQGAFLIPVASPYIKEFVVNKMVGQENLCVYDAKTKELQDKIHYCDFIEFTIKTHNILTEDFTGSITVECEGNILETIELNESHVLPQFEGTPAYNATYIKRKVYLDLKWVELLGHEEGSSKSYSFDVAFKLKDPSCFKHDVDASKIKKSIQKNVFYEEAWSINEEEVEAVPQIAEIFEPQVVTMEFEECRYTKLTVSHDIEKTNKAGEKIKEKREYTILEETDGCLSINENIPTFAVIAGDKTNKPKIEIAISGLDRSECNGEHKNAKLIIFNDGETTEMAMVDKPKGITTINLEVVSSLSAYNLAPLKYIWPSLIAPNVYRTHVATCRYARPLLVNVYPDIKWELEFKWNHKESFAYSYGNKMHPYDIKKGKEKVIGSEIDRGFSNNFGEMSQSFELSLKAKWDKDSQKLEVGKEWGQRIAKTLKLFNKMKAATDAIAKSPVNGGKISFEIKAPVIAVSAKWYAESSKSKTRVGTNITLGIESKPLVEAEGKINLWKIFREYGPNAICPGAGTIVDFVLQHIEGNVGISFIVVFTGSINVKGQIQGHTLVPKDTKGNLEIIGKIQVSIEFKAWANGSVGMASFEGYIKADVSTFISGGIKSEVSKQGLLGYPVLEFGGIIAKYVAVGSVKFGIFKRTFEKKGEYVIVKPDKSNFDKKYILGPY